MTAPQAGALRDLAVEIALAAGGLLIEARAGGAGLERLEARATRKSSATDLATDADRASEELVRQMLARSRPDDALLGEEGGATTGTSGLTWVVDPLDGTTNFVYDYPIWAVSIAVVDDAGVVAGAVYHPLAGETFAAARGLGATLNGNQLHRSAAPPLAECLVGTGFSYSAERRREQARLLSTVVPEVRDVRRGGSAAIDLCWVAAGRMDAFYESGLNSWDRAAGLVVASEAGVRTVELELDGPSSETTLVVAPAGLLDDLAALLRRGAAAT